MTSGFELAPAYSPTFTIELPYTSPPFASFGIEARAATTEAIAASARIGPTIGIAATELAAPAPAA